MLPVVIFDGECGFCTLCVRAARAYLRVRVIAVPYQVLSLSPNALEQVSSSVYFLPAHGPACNASAAVAGILDTSPLPLKPLTSLIRSNPRLFDRAYFALARNRSRIPRLPGSTPAVPPPVRHC